MKFPCRAFVQPVVSDTLVSFVWSYLDSGPSTTQMQVLESEFYGVVNNVRLCLLGIFFCVNTSK